MAKLKKRLDMDGQTNIFDAILSLQKQEVAARHPAGSFDLDAQFRAAISEALKQCPLSRYEVAGRMSELTGQDITKSMLDSWTAESKENHRFPAIFLPAFCEAVKSSEPFKVLSRPIGVFVMPGPDALRAEIQRLDEEAKRINDERKKRLVFLKEMRAK